jgi:hypothetical protein
MFVRFRQTQSRLQESLKRGEDVPSGLQPLTHQRVDRILRDAGWTAADVKHAELLSSVTNVLGDAVIEQAVAAALKASERAARAVVRRRARQLTDDAATS